MGAETVAAHHCHPVGNLRFVASCSFPQIHGVMSLISAVFHKPMQSTG